MTLRLVMPAVSALDVVAEVEEHLGRHVTEAALGIRDRVGDSGDNPRW